MVLAKQNLTSLCEGLKHNFLYNNDINSIHILLNLYDIESNMNNISPKYMSTRDIQRKVIKILDHRRDKELVSNKIVMMIHEDVDRLELIFHLEGYTNGYYNNRTVNMLEDATIRFYPIEKIYEYNYLFHYNSPYNSIRDLKANYFKYIDKGEEKNNKIFDFISLYCEELLRPKIYRLNENLDRQLRLDYRDEEIIIEEEETFLTIRELNEIYGIILDTIYKNVTQIYKDASWFGVNDGLLNRY